MLYLVAANALLAFSGPLTAVSQTRAPTVVMANSMEQEFIYDSSGARATDARRSILGKPTWDLGFTGAASNDLGTGNTGMGTPAVHGDPVSGSQPGFGPAFLYTQVEMPDKFAPGPCDASYNPVPRSN